MSIKRLLHILWSTATLHLVLTQDTDPYALLVDYQIDSFANCSLTSNIPQKVSNFINS